MDFEVIKDRVVFDQSGYRNNGYLDRHVTIKEHPQICGHYADLSNLGEILFSAQTFLGKPRTGITIACWVNIQTELTGKHSIFSTIRQTGANNYIGKISICTKKDYQVRTLRAFTCSKLTIETLEQEVK